eukprot:g2372.t1
MEGTALGILANGWKALEALSVADDLRKVNPKCINAEWRNSNGDLLTGFSLSDARCENEMRGVIRGKLLTTLAEALPPETVLFDHNLKSIDLTNPNQPMLKFDNGKEMKCRVVVGADGARSKVAKALDLPYPEYSGYCAIRGISNLGPVDIPRQTIIYYLASGMRFGMYQVEEDKIYWFFAFNASENYSLSGIDAICQKAKELSLEFDSVVQNCVANVVPDCLSFSKIGDRLVSPLSVPGKALVTLCGDAFHPMTPNLGQGGAMALEDSVVLGQQFASIGGLAASDEDMAIALRKYEQKRLKRVSPLVLRSRIFGSILQVPYWPVPQAAEFMISKVLNPGTVYLSTAQYNCGSLAAT